MKRPLQFFTEYLSLKFLSLPSSQLVTFVWNRYSILVTSTFFLVLAVMSVIQWQLISRMEAKTFELSALALKLAALNSMMLNLSNSHRFSLLLITTNQPDEKKRINFERLEAFHQYRKLLEKINKQLIDDSSVKNSFAKYQDASNELVALLEAKEIDKAQAFRSHILRPLYENWQQQQISYGETLTRFTEEKFIELQKDVEANRTFLVLTIVLPIAFSAFFVMCLIVISSLIISWSDRQRR